MVKKLLLMSILILSSFTFVYASPTNIQQILSTSCSVSSGSTCAMVRPKVTVDGLGTYNINSGLKFYYYELKFNETFEVNQAYHFTLKMYGSVTSAFYNTTPPIVVYRNGTNSQVYNKSISGSGTTTRTIEFDIYNDNLSTSTQVIFDWTLYSIYNGGSYCCEPLLYYSYTGNSTFGFTSISIEKLNSQDFDSLVSQNNIIINQNNQTNQNLTNINDSINSNATPPTSELNSVFNNFDNYLPTNNTISSLLTMPITLFTNVLNSINATCNSFNLGSLMGTNIVLPCLNLENLLGNTIWSLIDILFSGLFVFIISKKFTKVFNNFSSMKEGDVIGD